MQFLRNLLGNICSFVVTFFKMADEPKSPPSLSINVDGNKNGPILLFIHGFPDNGSLWDKQVSHFQSEYLCIRLTLPNYDTNKLSSTID